MAWVRIDDQAPEHPKLLLAGPVASWLWICGLAWCARHLSDGRLPQHVLKVLGIPKVSSAAQRLVQVGLWERTADGYHIHDYLTYQPSAEQVRKRRRATAQRVAAWKLQHGLIGSNTHDNSVSNIVGHAVTNPPPVPLPVPVPKDQDQECVPPASRSARQASSSGLMMGTLPRDHRGNAHALCFARGLCMPLFLVTELMGRLGGPEETRRERLRHWGDSVVATLPDESFGDSTLDFWRAHFAHAFGQVAPPPQTANERRRQLAEQTPLGVPAGDDIP